MKSGGIPKAEREKVARELHDLIGQPLTALKFMVASLEMTSDKNKDIVGEARELIGNLQVDVRKMIVNLKAEEAPKRPAKKK